MNEIKRFDFKKNGIELVKSYHFGSNWPIVYILEGGNEAYVGETKGAYNRGLEHLKNPERLKLQSMYVIADDEFNKSATLDIESSLIKYMAADSKYLLQNGNAGLLDSNYYDRERYQAKFQLLWQELKRLELVNKDLVQIENEDLFKYSPYKALTEDQNKVVEDILIQIEKGEKVQDIISGEPGTGKTIVATYLMKRLTSFKYSKHFKIGLVIPMTSLRKTLRKVFKSIKGLSPSMVIGPSDVIKQKYDLLIVDESHRLQRRTNITNFKDYDRVNSSLGLDKFEGNQLDWIVKASTHQILFYDQYQSIKPSDIRPEALNKYNFKSFELNSQMRVRGGDDYIKYIRNILDVRQYEPKKFNNYELKYFENFEEMVKAIKEKDKLEGLSRLLAGYSWKWVTNKNEIIDFDIEIEGIKLKWNSVTQDWVNSKDAVNEVGCIHTIQGYDLNYAGVIIGPELSYDAKLNNITVDKAKYLDFNGKRAITDPKELDVYIKNIYKTLLTRGIKGTYVYIVDKNLRNYMSKYFSI